jgi:cysteine-rich CPXCG protein
MMVRRGLPRDDGDDGGPDPEDLDDAPGAGDPDDEELHHADEDDEELGHADEDVAIACPYCGAPNEIALDPSGGRTQDYVEDCQVCCQPWNVHVRYGRDGTADVRVTAADAE